VLTPEQQMEANLLSIFHYYCLNHSLNPKSGQTFDFIHTEDTYMTLQNFSNFIREILNKVLKVPKAKILELFKKIS
jgi:hypothetical protein